MKSLIFDALRYQEFSLITKIGSIYPISLYYHEPSRAVAIYNCRPKHDEFIIIEGDKPGKLEIVIKEFNNSDIKNNIEIADTLYEIMNFRKPSKIEIIYLTQL